MDRERCADAVKLLKLRATEWSVAAADHFWLHLVRRLDARLRQRQNIFEFSSDPHCLFRIALCPAAGERVPPGLRIEDGDFIGELHLWNEHVPPLPDGGPNFLWARLIWRRARDSFALLAESVRSDRRFDRVRVFRAKTRLGGERLDRFGRLVKSFGFEQVEELSCGTPRECLIALGESLHLWALLRAFNPTALATHRLIQLRFRQLWMSRETLLLRYPAARRFAGAPVFEADAAAGLDSLPLPPLPSKSALA